MTKVKKILTNIAAFALGAVTCLGFCTAGFRDWSSLKKTANKVEQVYNGMVANVASSNGFSLAIASADEVGGVAAQAEGGYVITATVEKDGIVRDETLNWAISWANAESAWAAGKLVADYVTMTVGSNTMSVTVDAKTAFSEPIIVTATARQNKEKSATCQLDYVKRVSGFDLSSLQYNSDETVRSDEENSFAGKLLWGDGTILPSVTVSNSTLEVDWNYMEHEYNNAQGVECGCYVTIRSQDYNAADNLLSIAYYMQPLELYANSMGTQEDVEEMYNLLMNDEEVFYITTQISTMYGGAIYQENVTLSTVDNGAYLYDATALPERIVDVTLNKTNIAF